MKVFINSGIFLPFSFLIAFWYGFRLFNFPSLEARVNILKILADVIEFFWLYASIMTCQE